MADPVIPTLALVGELRPEQLELLDNEDRLDLLCSVSGQVPPFTGSTNLARTPARRPGLQLVRSYSEALAGFLAEGIDRLPQTPEWEARIERWIGRMVAERTQVRLTQCEPLHTRLISRPQSTLVQAGPVGPALGELRLELTGAPHQDARVWAQERFDRATDISDDILAVLEASWAAGSLDPEELYLKVLFEYFAPTLSGLDRETDENPMLEWLTDFQLEAYHFAKGILRRYGGVFLADVVGLGKTFIAMALLRHLHDRYGHDAVVVAPPSVLPAWEELARDHRVPLGLVSLGRLDDLDDFVDREVLVIDESHNFRNTGTARYERIQRWLRPGGEASARQVLLLSATPQNNDPRDVLNQLRFFPDNYTRLPYRGESLGEWFQEARRQPAELAKLLQHVVVRRTRGFVRAAHPDATLRRRLPGGGFETRPLRFPERISGAEQCLRYALDDRPEGSRIYDRTIEHLESMAYPLHGLGLYLLEEHREKPRLRRLRRVGRGLRGLYKVLLLKRLESSLEAFSISASRLLERLNEAIQLLAEGKIRARGDELGEDQEDGSDAGGRHHVLVDSVYFDRRRLMQDLQSDRNRVQQVVDEIAVLKLERDPKVERLVEWLQDRPPTQHRTLLFTQFADTAHHLAEHLGQRFGRTEMVTGGTPQRMAIARRFSPRSNRVEVAPSEEVDLLITTDALSEGVNLQDADTLVNYDLHWNPVRLIQRAGRIDRIGSENERIVVASFLPERGLEANLGIEEVLRQRIAEFLRVFGEDSEVLPSEDRPELERMVGAYSGRALDDADSSEDMDGLSRHANRILTLRLEEPERFAALADIRPGRRAGSPATSPSVAACRVGWYWRFYADAEGDLASLDDLGGLDRLHEHALAGPSQGSESGGEFVERARRQFDPEASAFLQQRRHPRRSAVEDWTLARMADYRQVCVPTQRALVDRLQAWVEAGQAKAVLQREARRWKRQKLAAAAVFHELRTLAARFPGSTEELGEPQVVGVVLGVGDD